MAIDRYPTTMIDQLEEGPWPSFISGIKRLRDEHPEARINEMTNSLLGQLEHSYETRKGYWKGGTVSVYGYGGGIIPRFSEVGKAFPESKEFHTLRVQPPAGNHYSTGMLRQLADSWEKWGSGLVTFHGQTGNIMFIGTTTDGTQHFFDEINDYGWDLGGAALRLPGIFREERQAEAWSREALEFCRLEEFIGQEASALPYGVLKRLEIARALAAKPSLLLMDEPAAGLNDTETVEMRQLIRRICASGVTVLLVEHNMGLVMDVSDRILVIDYGSRLAEGTPTEIQRNPKVIQAYLGGEVQYAV